MRIRKIKIPDLADSIGMSLRNLRRYEYGERKLSLPTMFALNEDVAGAFYFAKLGMLVESIGSPSMPDKLYAKYKCTKKPSDIQNSMNELERLIKVGKHIGSWYFSEEYIGASIK